jgi:hypothetical protein
MTEKIRALLDEGVAGVEPRDPDPVPDLLRRGRARRRHLAVAGAAGAVAVAVLATGGIVATNRSMPDNPPASQPATSPSGKVKGQKEEPVRIDATVAGGFVRTGGLAVPIPQGWQVIQDKRLDRCDIPADSVLINVMQLPGGTCNAPSCHQGVTSSGRPYAAHALASRGIRDPSASPQHRSRHLRDGRVVDIVVVRAVQSLYCKPVE